MKRLRQCPAGLEIPATQAQFGGQVLGQHLYLPVETGIEITAAIGLQFQAALQFALDLQRDLPGPAIDLRQLQTTAQGQRPVSLGVSWPLMSRLRSSRCKARRCTATPCSVQLAISSRSLNWV